MSKELNEDTSFKVSVKTLIAIGLGLSTLIGMWFTLQADIAEAKELPVSTPEVTRMEFDNSIYYITSFRPNNSDTF